MTQSTKPNKQKHILDPKNYKPWEKITDIKSLLNLLLNEKKRLKNSNLHQPSAIKKMKQNLITLPDVLKNCIAKLHLVSKGGYEGIEDIYIEISKYIITLTNSICIIKSSLCINLFNNIYDIINELYNQLYKFINMLNNKKINNKLKEKEVGILWNDLLRIKSINFDNKTGIAHIIQIRGARTNQSAGSELI